MRTDGLFRAAAIAWFVAAIARIVLDVSGLGPPGLDSIESIVLAAISVGIGVGVGGLLLWRPGRGSAVVASAFGLYAALGVAYAPLIGPQAWFVILVATGLVAFVLSVACLVRSWRAPSRGT